MVIIVSIFFIYFHLQFLLITFILQSDSILMDFMILSESNVYACRSLVRLVKDIVSIHLSLECINYIVLKATPHQRLDLLIMPIKSLPNEPHYPLHWTTPWFVTYIVPSVVYVSFWKCLRVLRRFPWLACRDCCRYRGGLVWAIRRAVLLGIILRG